MCNWPTVRTLFANCGHSGMEQSDPTSAQEIADFMNVRVQEREPDKSAKDKG